MQNNPTLSLKTKIALSLAIIFWASAFVAIRIGLQGYTPGSLALLRFLIASICMYLIYVRLPPRHPITWYDKLLMLEIGAITLGGYHLALNIGELTVPAGIASFIISQVPILTTIFAILFLGERINIGRMLGFTISIVGAILIMLGENNNVTLDIGVFYIFISAITGSAYNILQKPFLKKYHTIDVTAYTIWGGALVLLFYLPAATHEIFTAPLSATLAAIYLGTLPTAVACAAWSYALSIMPASRAANFIYFMPLIATLLGWMCLNEVPTWLALGGGLVALLGVWVVNESYTKHSLHPSKVIEETG